MNNKDKILSLQVFRGLAFLMIFLFHSGASEGLGSLAVSCFFVLSGFLMMRSHQSNDIRPKQAAKGILKLYPLHICAMLLMVIYYIYNDNIGWLLPRVATHTLLVQSVFPARKIAITLNGPSWFLSTLLFCRLLFPLCKTLLLRKKRTVKDLWTIILSLYAYQWILLAVLYGADALIHPEGIWESAVCTITYVSPLSRIVDFLIGAALWMIVKDQMESEGGFQNARSLLLTIPFLPIGVWLIWYNSFVEHWCFSAVAFVPISTALLYFFLYLEKNAGSIFQRLAIFVWIGNLSDALFLIHVPIIIWMRALIDLDAESWFVRGINLSLSLVIAVLYKRLRTKKSSE